jgi:hypothetical protein
MNLMIRILRVGETGIFMIPAFIFRSIICCVAITSSAANMATKEQRSSSYSIPPLGG